MINGFDNRSFLSHAFDIDIKTESLQPSQSNAASHQAIGMNAQIITFVDKVLKEHRQAQLTPRESCILHALLEDRTYQQAGKDSGYSEGTLQNAASKLFRDLSIIFDRDINRRNCQVMIQSMMEVNNSSTRPSETFQAAINIDLWMLVNHCQLLTLRSSEAEQAKGLLQSFFYRYYTHFHRAIWIDINLFNSLPEVLAELITSLEPIDLTLMTTEQMLKLLLERLREQRCLIALDCSTCKPNCHQDDFCHEIFTAITPHRHSSSFVSNCQWQPPKSEKKPLATVPQHLSIKTIDSKYLEIIEKLVFGQRL
jgi:hypothetical protein